jgi:hypothetical protein
VVLKDGQIVEQGTHKELLARDGVFASMWADQVSPAEVATSVGDSSKNEVTNPDHLGPTDNDEPTAIPYETKDGVENGERPEITEGAGITFPSSDTEPVDVAENAEPVQFPSSTVFPTDPARASPVNFPPSEDAPDHRNSLSASPSPPPGVTFDANLSPPLRTGTPDPDSEPKRKRISSQNFQRLARRISISAKRQSSSFIPAIPGLKRDSSPRVSVDDGRLERTDSPSSSVKNEDKGKKKKDKKERKPTA